jgi:soluble lytic murein transglycosylase-like protein
MKTFGKTKMFGCLGAVMLAGVALAVPAAPTATLFVYELADGSRIVTDHALNNPSYRLVRMGATAKGTGQLAASQNSQLFRSDPDAYDRLIRQYSAEFKVDFALVKAVMHVESSFNPYARSRKGALGLMQLLPETAKRHGIQDVYDPARNIEAGVRHLRYLSDTFDNKQYLVIAAYNAGENAVRQHRGIPPYHETQSYVRRVLSLKRQYAAVPTARS